MPAVPFDRAVMERTDRAAVVATDLEWSDVGNWGSVWQMSASDADGNVAVGNVHLHDSRRTYARSQGPLVGAVGVDDLAIIADDDAVLVAPLARAGDVKLLVDGIRRSDPAVVSDHRRVARPWGYYETLHCGEGHQVKRICVRPGARLSLQKHRHRAEHWVVVVGTALVTRGEATETLVENQSAYIAAGTIHRLANPGETMLEIIEVQLGTYLGEDDIVRIEDDYSRK
jgi:mannose-1-phosphate guanylyltransferase / mannose-6-phosphate isomerase